MPSSGPLGNGPVRSNRRARRSDGMRIASGPRALLVSAVVVALVQAQQNPPLQYVPPAQPQPQQQQPQQPQQVRPPANQPPTNVPARPAGQAPPPATTPQTAPPATAALTDTGGFLLDNVSLIELIDILARRLKINYILDPRVNGKVTIHTYGEVKPTDLMPLMETV